MVDEPVQDERRIDGGINQVVQIGQTIRRPASYWSTSVHELLRHLEGSEFEGAPRFIGIDQDDRETLSKVAGATPWPPGPALFDPTLLQSTANLLRRYHDAVADWNLDGAVWQSRHYAPTVVNVAASRGRSTRS